MQKRFQPPYAGFQSSDDTGEMPFDIDALLAAARRQLWVIVSAVILFILVGALYLVTAVPIYTASSIVLIDSANSRIVDQLSAVGGAIEDEAYILSQVELLRSDQIALSVVDSLKLIDDPRFGAQSDSVLSGVRELIASLTNMSQLFASDAVTRSDAERRSAAARQLTANLGVARVGRTYVLQMNYSSASPALASEIANGYAEAYLNDQLDSKYEATRRAGTWLQDRIAELREQSLQSDLAVQNYRAEKGLISTGGQLLSDQELSQITEQLVDARGETANASARLESIDGILNSGQMDAVVSDALDMPVISEMRSRYLEASRQEADISARLGENHATAVRLRSEMQEYRRLMFEELGRIAESYRSSLQIAQARQAGLEQQLATATGVSTTASDSLVQLRELEREAETYRNLYQTFLQRYQEAVQQQSFPITEARIISRAEPPERPSSPRMPLTLALSAALGMMLGSGLGALREFRDRYYRTGDQVRSELNMEFLGMVPVLRNVALGRRRDGEASDPSSRQIVRTESVTAHVLDKPMSLFAETIRSTKLAADLVIKQKSPKVIGVVSVLAGEGKSTVAINLAEHLAKQGKRTLLMDCDLRNASSSRALAPAADKGIVEVLLGTSAAVDTVFTDADSGLVFLPSSGNRSIPYSSELLGSQAMSDLLAGAAQSFDYVIVDLPPLGPVIDARAMADKIDTFVLVVEWGKTTRRLVRSTLQSEHQVAEKCIGVILNKVDIKKFKLYDSDGSSTYYGGRHAYYVESD